jgi:hypothetical protein
MKTPILTSALALAALSLAACGPRTDAGNTTATDTLTLNEEGDAGLGNGDAFETTGNAVTIGNDAGLADNVIASAGNAL